VSALVRLAVSDSSPVDVASFSPLGRLASSLRSIDQLDRRSRCLTVANNWAYYTLGTVYKAFCMVIRPSSSSPLLPIPTPLHPYSLSPTLNVDVLLFHNV
jgi:hypothetical protein